MATAPIAQIAGYSSMQPSGLEAAIIASAAAAVSGAESGNGYFHRGYEVAMQQRYVSSQVRNSAHNAYSITTASAFPATSSEKKEKTEAIYHSQPFAFLSPNRPRTSFIAAAFEISAFIREAFAGTTGKELPEDITVTVAPRQQLQLIHKQFFNNSVVGLSLNGSVREVFAVAGSLDEVMLVIGHELGHVFTPTLSSERAEEAKAFAFEMAWAQAIFQNDIGGLRNSINAAALSMEPAQNGLHDTAFAFVKSQATSGKEPLQLHSQIVWNSGIDFDESENAATPPAATPTTYVPLVSSPSKAYHSGGYRNVSNVQNVPWMNNFSWADLGTGIYGMYLPLTASIFMNDRLLRTDLEQFHKTLGHEYILHHVMQLPDGYVAKIMEETIFWVDDKPDRYKK